EDRAGRDRVRRERRVERRRLAGGQQRVADEVPAGRAAAVEAHVVLRGVVGVVADRRGGRVEPGLPAVAADGLGEAAPVVALPRAVVLGAALDDAVRADADRLELQRLQALVDALVPGRDHAEVL